MDTVQARQARPGFGVLSEDLQGALTVASRLQQRGLSVDIVQDPSARPVGTDAVVVDMNVHNIVRDLPRRVGEWAQWLAATGVTAMECRFDTELRGAPGPCLEGLITGADLPDPTVLVVGAYPSSGRVCIDGRMVIPALHSPAMEVDIARRLFGGQTSRQVGLDEVTAGEDHVLSVIQAARAAGERRFVFDGTTDGHLATVSAVAQRLRNDGVELLTASTGGWLRFYPPTESDGFVLLVSPVQAEVDSDQLAQVATAYGSDAVTITSAELMEASGEHLDELLSVHRVLIMHESEQIDDDRWSVADGLGAATRRILEVAQQGRSRCLGVITSGGLTTSAIFRRLEPVSLRAGQELEPLCPVARLVGGPFDNLPVISKASGVGNEQTPVRLIRRLVGN
ncbi:hypothetical protein GCM10009804_56180 [Kribbella hippodromi]|uniref:Four-carbon acid sugar kinase family protein n=1 Tax=Kribbella hippodromi TaxID=434347 RepID=A0ABP4PVM0_9ACTN